MAFAAYEICPDQYQAFVDNESLDLTRREYELIELFASADNEVFDRELIARSSGGTLLRARSEVAGLRVAPVVI